MDFDTIAEKCFSWFQIWKKKTYQHHNYVNNAICAFVDNLVFRNKDSAELKKQKKLNSRPQFRRSQDQSVGCSCEAEIKDEDVGNADQLTDCA